MLIRINYDFFEHSSPSFKISYKSRISWYTDISTKFKEKKRKNNIFRISVFKYRGSPKIEIFLLCLQNAITRFALLNIICMVLLNGESMEELRTMAVLLQSFHYGIGIGKHIHYFNFKTGHEFFLL